MLYVVFLVALAVGSMATLNISYRKAADASTDAVSSPALSGAIASAFLTVIFAVLALLRDGKIAFETPQSALFAVAFGVSFAVAVFVYVRALDVGPYTLSVIIFSSALFMPTVYSAIFLGESLSGAQIITIAVILVACVLLSLSQDKNDTTQKKVSLLWAAFITVDFLCDSVQGFFIRVNTLKTPGTSENSFFFLAFAASFAVSMIIFALTGGFKKKVAAKPLMLPALGVAASLTLNLIPNALLPNYISAALQYPLLNGLNLVFGVLCGIIVFRERLTRRAAALSAVILVCIIILSILENMPA